MPMSAKKRDYYEVLEVTREATFEEIKRSYRKLAVKHHPDKNPGDAHAEERFKELGEAYDILADEQKRAAYDRHGHAAFAQGGAGAGGFGGGFHDPFDIFREAFGSAGGGGSGGIFEQILRRRRRRWPAHRSRRRASAEPICVTTCRSSSKKPPVRLRKGNRNFQTRQRATKCSGSGAETRLTRDPAARPATGAARSSARAVFSRFRKPCPRCKGTGQIVEKPCRACEGEGRASKRDSRIKLKIPAGIEDGSRLRSSRNGEAGIRGGAAGRSLRRHPHQGAPGFSARGGQPVLRSADLIPDRHARR